MQLKSIVLVSGIFPPDIGGPASFIPLFAEQLTKRGIDVSVVTLSDKPQDDTILPYKVIRISRGIKKPIRDMVAIAKIVKAAKNSDLIFSNTLAFESSIASILTKKKLVQKIVGDIAWERASASGRFDGNLEEYQKSNLDIKSRFTNWYRNFGVQKSDFIITPSDYLKHIVTNWNYPANKIKVIYNCIELQECNVKIKKNKFRIISVARLIPHKGIESILNTLDILQTKIDKSFDFEYIVIGDGILRTKLMEMANRLRIDVKFIGNISKLEVANWLNSSDLFILNSSYEGLPHIVLEAMANGCPVIASCVGGTPEILKNMENGLLFEYNNEQELLEKINLIKNDSNLRDYLIKNGKDFIAKFSNLDKMVDEYIELIEKII